MDILHGCVIWIRPFVLPVLAQTRATQPHISFHPQSTWAQWEHDVAASACTEQHTATYSLRLHITTFLLVYVIWAELVLLGQVQSRLPLPVSDEIGQLVLGTQLSDGHHHPPPHHCGRLALLLPLAKRPMQRNTKW